MQMRLTDDLNVVMGASNNQDQYAILYLSRGKQDRGLQPEEILTRQPLAVYDRHTQKTIQFGQEGFREGELESLLREEPIETDRTKNRMFGAIPHGYHSISVRTREDVINFLRKGYSSLPTPIPPNSPESRFMDSEDLELQLTK